MPTMLSNVTITAGFCDARNGVSAHLQCKNSAWPMSPSGQKQTRHDQMIMSALPPKADIAERDGMSALCQKRTFNAYWISSSARLLPTLVDGRNIAVERGCQSLNRASRCADIDSRTGVAVGRVALAVTEERLVARVGTHDLIGL